jgi:LysR family nitrogen assimilation transcriptional regulator
LETRALRYFQTVAEFGSYSRGSEFLRISLPAVSRQIRRLDEEELGHALLKRHGHGVSLTDAGRILLGRSQVALRQLEQTKAEIQGAARQVRPA